MARKQNPNIEILRLALDRLGAIADEFVFVGGCAAGMLITDAAAPSIRATVDVDAVVQVSSRADYYRLSTKLRARGFSEDRSKGAPVCRWLHAPLILDVMPTDKDILGFGNSWYEGATRTAQTIHLDTGESLKLITAPYFIVTKLDAFDNRGYGDFQMSHDMEDIIAVIDGRPELLAEIQSSEPALVQAIASRFQKLLKNPGFVQSIPGHMPGDAASQQRVPGILQILKSLVDNLEKK